MRTGLLTVTFADSLRPLLIVALLSAAFIGNASSVPLFLGVEFIFGSIATFLMLLLFGPAWAVVCAIFSSVPTWSQWGHPWAIVILTCEALSVAWLYPRLRRNLIVADAAFWLVGSILVSFFYGVILDLEPPTVNLIILKMVSNAIFNAWVSSLTLVVLPGAIRSSIGLPSERTIFEFTFHLLVAGVFLPGFALTAIANRQSVRAVERQMQNRLDATTISAHHRLEAWLTELAAVVTVLSERAPAQWKSLDSERKQAFQRELDATLRARPGLQSLRFEDASGRLFVARERRTRLEHNPSQAPLSDSILKQGSIARQIDGRTKVAFDGSVLSIQSAVRGANGKVMGSITAAIDRQALSDLLSTLVSPLSGEALLLDEQGRWLATSSGARTPRVVEDGKPNTSALTLPRGLEASFYQRFPEGNTIAIRRWRDLRIGHRSTLSGSVPWRLTIEAPLAPDVPLLTEQSTHSLALMLLVAGATVGLATLYATRLARPLARLARATRDLPERLNSRRTAPLPMAKSAFSEVNKLTTHFHDMSLALAQRFADLRRASLSLEQGYERLSHEVSRRRRIEEELRRAARLKDEFLSGLSHELRTPLNAVSGFVEILRDDGWDPDESPQMLDVIGRNVKLLSKLIEDLLDSSALAGGRAALKTTELAVASVLSSSIRSIEAEARRHRIELVRTETKTPDLDAASDLILGDPDRLQKAFDHVLENALKFTPDGGKVTVALSGDSAWVDVRISDTGEGVSADFLPMMFSRFRQENAMDDREHGGLGLGLSLVREIVRLHGGETFAESAGKGLGTTISIRLPRLGATPWFSIDATSKPQIPSTVGAPPSP